MSAEHLHDPGGKVRIKIQDGIRGSATFSPCGRYRTVLAREWTDKKEPRFALWIGMNPSTAGPEVDDPTCLREVKRTIALGLEAYIKCNVMDFRATKPKMLLDPGVQPCSSENISSIRALAAKAELIILAYGTLHKKLSHYGRDVVQALHADGHKLWVLGTTQDGSPRHSLYVGYEAELIPYLPAYLQGGLSAS